MSSAILPANLPSVAKARLPEVYERAKVALIECSRIDECQNWADKAEALSSYAKQAKDESLRKLVDRIQARAVRRCGKLLREIEPRHTGRPPENREGDHPNSRKSTASEAGLSDHQRKTALRVANVPEQEFEAAIESSDPPTVTELADRGKKSQSKPLVDLRGRDPEEFFKSTKAQGAIRRLMEVSNEVPAKVVVRGAMPNEYAEIKQNVRLLLPWLRKILDSVEVKSK